MLTRMQAQVFLHRGTGTAASMNPLSTSCYLALPRTLCPANRTNLSRRVASASEQSFESLSSFDSEFIFGARLRLRSRGSGGISQCRTVAPRATADGDEDAPKEVGAKRRGRKPKPKVAEEPPSDPPPPAPPAKPTRTPRAKAAVKDTSSEIIAKEVKAPPKVARKTRAAGITDDKGEIPQASEVTAADQLPKKRGRKKKIVVADIEAESVTSEPPPPPAPSTSIKREGEGVVVEAPKKRGRKKIIREVILGSEDVKSETVVQGPADSQEEGGGGEREAGGGRSGSDGMREWGDVVLGRKRTKSVGGGMLREEAAYAQERLAEERGGEGIDASDVERVEDENGASVLWSDGGEEWGRVSEEVGMEIEVVQKPDPVVTGFDKLEAEFEAKYGRPPTTAVEMVKGLREEREREWDMDALERKYGRREEERPLVVYVGEAINEFVPGVKVSSVQMDHALINTWKGLQWKPPEFARAPAGASWQAAVALARLGGRAAFLGKVGGDEAGQFMVAEMERQGVVTTGVRVAHGLSTGRSEIEIGGGEEGGLRARVVRHSAESAFEEGEVDEELLEEATILHCTSLSLTQEPMRSALMTAVKTAKEKGALIFLDANFALPLWQNPAETDVLLEPLWAQADVVELSLAEVEFLLGETYFALRRRGRSQYISPTENRPEVVREEYHYTREELQQVTYPYVKLLLITDGTWRIHYYTDDFHGSVAGTEDVIVAAMTCDRTGSGDAIVGAIIRKMTMHHELWKDEVKLQKALRFAIAAGIIAQWTQGGVRGLPTESAAQNLMEQVFVPSAVAP